MIRVKMYVSARIPVSPTQTNVTLSAVYTDDPANPNKVFTDSVPYGQMNLVVQNNKESLDEFVMMREFLVDFMPVDQTLASDGEANPV